jgi:O-antigen/teichoic acid export membrane protein
LPGVTISQRIAFGAAASWFSRGATILLGLLLMPVLFRHLPKEELGVWLLLGQSWAALGIFDLGFGITLKRRIAFAKGRSGSNPEARLTDEALGDIADLIATGRQVYRALAVFAFCFSFVAGFFYLRSLELSTVSLTRVWAAWGILCASQGLAVWATIWSCLLEGVGYIGWDSLLATLMNALTLMVQIMAVFLGGGLVALAIIAACGSLGQRFLILGFARRKRPELFAIEGRWNPALFKSMVPLALRAWVTSLGLALVLNTDQLFIGTMLGPTELPAYRAAYLILLNLNALSVTIGSASAVFVSHLWQAGEVREVHRIVTRNLRMGLGMMACGGACVLALGSRLFDLWLGKGHFVGYPILIIFFLLLFLEAQCFIITAGSRATEDEAFAPWALAAGGLKLVLSALLGLRFGLIGIAAATLIAQLTTNHWFMVYRGLRRLKMSLREHVLGTLVPVSFLFVLTFLCVRCGASFVHGHMVWAQVAVGGAIAAFILLGFFWQLVLNRTQRRRLGAWAGTASSRN